MNINCLVWVNKFKERIFYIEFHTGVTVSQWALEAHWETADSITQNAAVSWNPMMNAFQMTFIDLLFSVLHLYSPAQLQFPSYAPLFPAQM